MSTQTVQKIQTKEKKIDTVGGGSGTAYVQGP